MPLSLHRNCEELTAAWNQSQDLLGAQGATKAIRNVGLPFLSSDAVLLAPRKRSNLTAFLAGPNNDHWTISQAQVTTKGRPSHTSFLEDCTKKDGKDFVRKLRGAGCEGAPVDGDEEKRCGHWIEKKDDKLLMCVEEEGKCVGKGECDTDKFPECKGKLPGSDEGKCADLSKAECLSKGPEKFENCCDCPKGEEGKDCREGTDDKSKCPEEKQFYEAVIGKNGDHPGVGQQCRRMTRDGNVCGPDVEGKGEDGARPALCKRKMEGEKHDIHCKDA